ncbi:TRAP transporter substrate-binding protein [Pseudomonas sp. SB113]|uniref:TRAP transporter substrate-binding protein n=1 Tax=Pseudomonas sp. SB113 TaxID=3154123 RepID=UPI00345D46B8
MKPHQLGRWIITTLSGLLASIALAETVQPTQLNVVGGGSHNYTFRAVEVPFWNTTLPDSSGGMLTARVRGLSESGLKGPEMVRLIRSGAVEIGMGVFAFVAGDDPFFEGIDLPGMAANIDTAHRVSNAFKPVLAQRMAEHHGIKLLATVPYTAQVFFCRTPVTSIADLKGRKIRVRGRNMSDLVKALGGSPMTLPFAEVVTAMQTGVIDCAVSGIGSGNAARWYEVANHLYNLPIDWSIGFYAIGLERWQALPEPFQRLLEDQSRILEARAWEETAKENRSALACNIGAPDCQIHHPANMQVHTPTPVERQALNDAVLNIANHWGKRCGAQCVERWNATAGAALGVTLQTP